MGEQRMIGRRRLAVLGFATLVAVVSSAHYAGVQAADEVSKQIPARVELHQIQTLTLPDEKFLTGDSSGQAVTISGAFRIAQGQGRLPVVVLLHGSGGPSG